MQWLRFDLTPLNTKLELNLTYSNKLIAAVENLLQNANFCDKTNIKLKTRCFIFIILTGLASSGK